MKPTRLLMFWWLIAGGACETQMNAERSAPGTIEIGSEVACASCSIIFETVATIDTFAFQGPSSFLARDAADQFYIVDAGRLVVYDANGRFLRSIGREGAGPGEYTGIRNVLVGSDGIVHILDGDLARISRFSPNGEFLGSASTMVVASGLGWDAALLPNDRILVNARPSPTVDSVPLLQVIDYEGNATASFGDRVPGDPRQAWLQERLLWARSSGEVLATKRYEFTGQLYGPDLQPKLTFRRIAEWSPLAPPADLSDGTFDTPPNAFLNAVWEDMDGILWLNMYIPSPEWKPQRPLQPGSENFYEEYRRLAARPRLVGMLEAIDLEAGTVLARWTSAGPIGTPFGGGYFATNETNAGGLPSLRISRVRLLR